MNQPISFIFKVGLPFLSVDSCVEMFESIYGLKKAIKSVADECMPRVPANASIVNPVRNPRISSNQPGISKGKSMMNKM